MALTPVEIRHIRLGRGFRGYKRHSVDTLLVEVAESFEDVWRERADLADKVEQLETDLVRYRELEALLRTTLVSAEQASAQTRDQARREAELILGQAHAEAGARWPRTNGSNRTRAGCGCSCRRHSPCSASPSSRLRQSLQQPSTSVRTTPTSAAGTACRTRTLHRTCRVN